MRLGVEAPRGHIMHHRYSLTGCPFGVLIMVILSPFSSSPRLISGIPVTGFRLRFLVPGLPSEARGHHSGGNGHVCREEKKIISRLTPLLGSDTPLPVRTGWFFTVVFTTECNFCRGGRGARSGVHRIYFTLSPR